LQRAINQLKQRNFQTTAPTGLPEFDQVVADFNSLAAELKRAEDLRKDLISDTSHELKTPIHSLTMQVQAMIDGLVPPSRVELEQMLVQINRLDDLSEQLQDYARIRSQLVRPTPTRFELLPLVQAVAQDYAADIIGAGIQIEFDIPTGHIIEADRALLERLLGNLFRNTIIHAQARHITVSAHEHQLVFNDDGSGVESRHLGHLFERFYQAKSRGQSGLGLGLSIVSDIAEAHGWRVHASSAAGHGFIVTLELPVATDTSKKP
jgi:signal transduction histidine kinase